MENQKTQPPQKIAIKCEKLEIDKINEVIVCDAEWLPEPLRVPFDDVHAVWQKHNTAVVSVSKIRQLRLFMAVRAETIPAEQPDDVEYTVAVCQRGHKVELVDDEYYCPVCRRSTDEGLRIRLEKHKLLRDYDDAEAGHRVVDLDLVSERNIRYFFRQMFNVEPDGVGAYGVNTISFIYVEKEEKRKGVAVSQGVGFVRYSDVDGTYEELRDLGYYVALSAGATAWKKIRDVTLEDVLAAVRHYPRIVADLIERIPKGWRETVCDEAWRNADSAFLATQVCFVCGTPRVQLNENITKNTDSHDLRRLAECLEMHGLVELSKRFIEIAQKLEEEEKKRQEEIRKKYEEKKKKKEMQRLAKIEEIKSAFENLPIVVEEKSGVIYVKLDKYVDQVSFKKYVETCKRLGFKFDAEKRIWYLVVEHREFPDYDF